MLLIFALPMQVPVRVTVPTVRFGVAPPMVEGSRNRVANADGSVTEYEVKEKHGVTEVKVKEKGRKKNKWR